MVHPLVALAILVAIMILGLIVKVRAQLKNVEYQEFLQKYLKEFITFANGYFEGKKFDTKRYDWLVRNSDEAQNVLGSTGIVQYQAPFGRFTHSHYQVLINTIPSFGNGTGPNENEVNMVDTAFRRSIGIRQSSSKQAVKELKNPLSWLTAGVSTLLALPLSILKELGIISNGALQAVKLSRLFKFLVGVISLVGLIETVIGILTGKSAVSVAIEALLRQLGVQ